MLCQRPFMIGITPCACGKCMPCLINRRRIWTHRLLLESYMHLDSCFATLTYDDAHKPINGSLCKDDYRDWLKRLRYFLSPRKIRFFLAAEYGGKTKRPHYHCALFGVSCSVAGGADGLSGLVRKAWPFGFTQVGDLNEKSAAYICGYVTKKFQSTTPPGCEPEFIRMSLRPGIGASSIPSIETVVSSEFGIRDVVAKGDVPFALRHNLRKLPLGRYLRGLLREAVGFGSRKAPIGAGQAYAQELRRLLSEALKDPQNASHSFAKILVDMNKGKVVNLIARQKIMNREIL